MKRKCYKLLLDSSDDEVNEMFAAGWSLYAITSGVDEGMHMRHAYHFIRED